MVTILTCLISDRREVIMLIMLSSNDNRFMELGIGEDYLSTVTLDIVQLGKMQLGSTVIMIMHVSLLFSMVTGLYHAGYYRGCPFEWQSFDELEAFPNKPEQYPNESGHRREVKVRQMKSVSWTIRVNSCFSISVPSQAGLYSSVFGIDAAPQDTFLKTTNFSKGVVLVNGFNLGRYWNTKGPQYTLFVPRWKLNKGLNTIVLFELEGAVCGARCFVEFVDQPILDGPIHFAL